MNIQKKVDFPTHLPLFSTSIVGSGWVQKMSSGYMTVLKTKNQ